MHQTRVVADQGRYRAVVIGSSLGGVEALQVVLSGLRTVLPVPVLIAHHVGPSGSALDRVLHRHSRLPVEWARDGARAEPGVVYLCPPRQQMRLEAGGTLTVQLHLRPTSLGTVDHLLAATAAALGDGVLAIVLSGTGRDGRDGARAVRERGGTVLVQDELTSIAYGMPGAVAEAGLADLVLPLAEIPHVLDQIVGGGARLEVLGMVYLEAALAAGGEMGSSIADTDWSATPLGPLDSWPPALCAGVTAVLGSRMAMLLCWGPASLAIYNDAFGALVGDVDVALLGRPVLRTLPEHAPTLEPILRAVLATGEAHLGHDRPFPLLRGGGAQERYCTIGASPLREGAAVAGVLGTFFDVTAQVQSSRRLRTLHSLIEPGHGAGACGRAAAVLAEDHADLPFVLIYQADRTGTQLHLAAAVGVAVGLAAGGVAVPAVVTAQQPVGWPERLPGLPAGPVTALPGGRRADGTPAVVLVLGLNPAIELDEPYRDFLDLVAAHVGASVLAAGVD